jgi:hypothetical protein
LDVVGGHSLKLKPYLCSSFGGRTAVSAVLSGVPPLGDIFKGVHGLVRIFTLQIGGGTPAGTGETPVLPIVELHSYG